MPAAKVGLLVVATGKYICFVKPLLDSANNYFCPQDEVTYFIFTDGMPPADPNVVKFHHKRAGWPYDTMMRCAMYLQHTEELAQMDYLFACDADMLFVDTVGNEIFSGRVATQHPGFVGKRGSYETNMNSTAGVRANEGEQYFAGGFYGGSAKEFLRMTRIMVANIFADLDKNMIAVWHDESHLNRYFIDNPPTKILSPEYCYPESWDLPYHKRLLALDKNHSEFRS
jgi:histo-blood group ABO system transferase